MVLEPNAEFKRLNLLPRFELFRLAAKILFIRPLNNLDDFPFGLSPPSSIMFNTVAWEGSSEKFLIYTFFLFTRF